MAPEQVTERTDEGGMCEQPDVRASLARENRGACRAYGKLNGGGALVVCQRLLFCIWILTLKCPGKARCD